MAIIQKAAKANGTVLRKQSQVSGKSIDIEKSSKIFEAAKDKKHSASQNTSETGLKTIMKHPLLRRWSINLYFNWSVNALVYYGLSNSADAIGESMSVYVTFMLLAAVEIPFVILVTIAMNKYGRRWPLTGSMVAAGVCCLVSAFSGHGMVHTIVGVAGKGCIAASFALVYFYTAEIYPTSLRSAGLGLCSTMARIGGFLAPYVVVMVIFVCVNQMRSCF